MAVCIETIIGRIAAGFLLFFIEWLLFVYLLA
jgi:hypothetical protein